MAGHLLIVLPGYNSFLLFSLSCLRFSFFYLFFLFLLQLFSMLTNSFSFFFPQFQSRILFRGFKEIADMDRTVYVCTVVCSSINQERVGGLP